MSVTKIAIVGNPNTGKTTLFNLLTNENKKTGNYSGVTVSRYSGFWNINAIEKVELADIPGCYSLFPKSEDEKANIEILFNNEIKPDILFFVADSSNLKRSLQLLFQWLEFKIPTIFLINSFSKNHSNIDIQKLSSYLKIPVYLLDFKNEKNKHVLENEVENTISSFQKTTTTFLKENINFDFCQIVFSLNCDKNISNNLHQQEEIRSKKQFFLLEKYKLADSICEECISNSLIQTKNNRFDFDKIFLNKFLAFPIFIFLIFLTFQLLYSLSQYPINGLEFLISETNNFLKYVLGNGILSSILADAIVTGVGSVLIFVPQIAILIAILSFLEESGYMARVVVMMNKIMYPLGLNGKSVVPLISGIACAIPAILSARTIKNPKERLLTILVTPFMSCSARLPVYTVLISVVIPSTLIFGFINTQALVFISLYLGSTIIALFTAALLNKLIKTKPVHYSVVELPNYRFPNLIKVLKQVYLQSKDFVFGSGKIIIAISIILWALTYFSPQNVSQILSTNQSISQSEIEVSFVGIIGKFIEPIFLPLGFDWKIDIALITSFAAREVFVGTMSVLYNANQDGYISLVEAMKNEINPITNKPLYTLNLGLALLTFYMLALQCMSTIAVVYQETKSFVYPLLQWIYMSGLAYLLAMFIYWIPLS